MIRRLAHLSTPFLLFFLLFTCGLSPNSNRGLWAGELWAVSSIALLSPPSTLSRQAPTWREVKLMSRQRRAQASGGTAASIALSVLRLRAGSLSARPLLSQALPERMQPASCVSQCHCLPLWNYKLKQ